MNVISYVFHSVGKLDGIGNDPSGDGISFIRRPTVVDYHVLVSCLVESETNDGISGLHDDLFVNISSERVP